MSLRSSQFWLLLEVQMQKQKKRRYGVATGGAIAPQQAPLKVLQTPRARSSGQAAAAARVMECICRLPESNLVVRAGRRQICF